MAPAPALAAAYAHCAELLRSEDHDGWLASLFVPADRRPSVQALRAVFGELGRVRDRVRQPLAGELRLQWWQDAVAGAARGDAEANPLAAALLDTLARFALPRQPVVDAIEAYRTDLYDEPLAATDDLRARLRATIGGRIELECRILDRDGAQHRSEADAAVALGCTNILRSLSGPRPRTALVPDDMLAQAGMRRAEFEAGAATTGAVAQSLRDLARAHLDRLRVAASGLSPDVGPAFLPTALIEPLLRLSERRSRGDHGLALPRWRVQWILWKAARGGRFGERMRG